MIFRLTLADATVLLSGSLTSITVAGVAHVAHDHGTTPAADVASIELVQA